MQSLVPGAGQTRLQVFGYGSLIWKPNFPYSKRRIGYIKGYLVRFYQGNITQRGSPGRPGRVATLVPAPSLEARVWGCAYEVLGKEDVQLALNRLIEREVLNGGYKFDRIQFYPVQSYVAESSSRQKVENWILPEKVPITNIPQDPFEVLYHLTDPEVDLYLGETSMEAQADQIVSAFGSSGANSEYVLLLAAFLRTEVPKDAITEHFDPYVFELEVLVRQRLAYPILTELVPPKQSNKAGSKETVTHSDFDVLERRRLSAREFAENHLLAQQKS